LDACKVPPILTGEKSPIEVTDKGRIELTNRRFKNVLRIPKFFVNLLSMYQMKKYKIGKRFIFTHDLLDIYDMKTNSMVSTSEVNHQSRLYTFSEFIQLDIALLVTHADERSRIWHEKIRYLNFRYMQQIIIREWFMVYLTSNSPKEFVRDLLLENTLKKNSTKERLKRIPFF
jgi:hypothetical protein